MLGVLAAVLAGGLVLFGFGQALGARSHAQRAADLSAISAAQVMRRSFPRLFEPPFLETGLPNPHHLSKAAYLSLARDAARRGARRNGVEPARIAIDFPGGAFAPTRVTVAVREAANLSLPDERRHRIEPAAAQGRRRGLGRAVREAHARAGHAVAANAVVAAVGAVLHHAAR